MEGATRGRGLRQEGRGGTAPGRPGVVRGADSPLLASSLLATYRAPGLATDIAFLKTGALHHA